MSTTASDSLTGSRPATPVDDRLLRARLDRQLSWLLPLFVIGLLLASWELASRLHVVNPIVLPPFTEVMEALTRLVQTDYFWAAAKATTIETVAGFAIGSGLALVLGSLIGMFRLARYALYPPAVAFQIVPRVALAPLFVTWFGFGLMSRIVMAAAICFFPVLINVVVGMETASQEARTFMRSLGASRWQLYRKLYFPSSLPLLFAGLKNAITLALIGAIVAEFIGGAEGMGVLIKTLNFQLAVADGFAVIVALMLIGLLLYGVMEVLDKTIVFWRSHS